MQKFCSQDQEYPNWIRFLCQKHCIIYYTQSNSKLVFCLKTSFHWCDNNWQTDDIDNMDLGHTSVNALGKTNLCYIQSYPRTTSNLITSLMATDCFLCKVRLIIISANKTTPCFFAQIMAHVNKQKSELRFNRKEWLQAGQWKRTVRCEDSEFREPSKPLFI